MTQAVVTTGGAGGMGLAVAKLMGIDHRVVIFDPRPGSPRRGSGRAHRGRDRRRHRRLRHRRPSVGRSGARSGGVEERPRPRRLHTAGISPQMGSAALVARINGTGTVNVTQAHLAHAGEGDVRVNVASTAGHCLPRVLIPFEAFRTAENNPAVFEKAIVRRARAGGKKWHSGIARHEQGIRALVHECAGRRVQCSWCTGRLRLTGEF